MYLKIRIFLVKNIVIDRRTIKCEGCLLKNIGKGLKNGDEVEWNRSNSLHSLFWNSQSSTHAALLLPMNKEIAGVYKQKLKYPFIVSPRLDSTVSIYCIEKNECWCSQYHSFECYVPSLS